MEENTFLNVGCIYNEDFNQFPECTSGEFSHIFEKFFQKFKYKIDKLELLPFSSDYHNSKIEGIIHANVELEEVSVLFSFDMKTINILSNDIKDKPLCGELVRFFQEEGKHIIKKQQEL